MVCCVLTYLFLAGFFFFFFGRFFTTALKMSPIFISQIWSPYFTGQPQSLLTYCMQVWYAGCSAEGGAPEWSKNCRENPRLAAVFSWGHCFLMLHQQSHHHQRLHIPHSHLFELLPSGRHCRLAKTHTSWFRKQFSPQAISTLNKKNSC